MKIYINSPITKYKELSDLYEDVREDQLEDMENFSSITQNILNNEIYERYKSFFYRYQDYNQITR
jgi:hypothetical protein